MIQLNSFDTLYSLSAFCNISCFSSSPISIKGGLMLDILSVVIQPLIEAIIRMRAKYFKLNLHFF